ncbi:MAG TPA: hypothetical protein VHM25_04145 [Polyangiaceae bacterium]|nr:hypothetical protein [Polyangiaceae bacterium]
MSGVEFKLDFRVSTGREKNRAAVSILDGLVRRVGEGARLARPDALQLVDASVDALKGG